MTARLILTDEEIRAFTLWETDEEVVAWAEGWRARIEAGPHNRPAEPEYGKGDTQNERVAWQRGWLSADAVCSGMCFPEVTP